MINLKCRKQKQSKTFDWQVERSEIDREASTWTNTFDDEYMARKWSIFTIEKKGASPTIGS